MIVADAVVVVADGAVTVVTSDARRATLAIGRRRTAYEAEAPPLTIGRSERLLKALGNVYALLPALSIVLLAQGLGFQSNCQLGIDTLINTAIVSPAA